MDNRRKYALTGFLTTALNILPLSSAGCVGGYYSHYPIRDRPHYIHEDVHIHGSLDPRLAVQHQKLNNWYQDELERAQKKHFYPGGSEAFLHDLDVRYLEGLRQLNRGQFRRVRESQRRLERDLNRAIRRTQRHLRYPH